MSARDDILSAIRAAAVPPSPPVHVPSAGGSIDGVHDRFLRMLAEVGGQGVIRPTDQPMDVAIRRLCGGDAPAVLTVRGRFAVAENAAVYVDAADVAARNAIMLAEHVLLVVPYAAIVPTMHEAMRLMPSESACGWFLSGPSKTADIEQSLVFGAQGARTLRVIFDAPA